MKLHGNRGLEFEPGSRWEYSNYGFVLLGAVIEKVSGTSYYEHVASHVFAPAGMTATGLFATALREHRLLNRHYTELLTTGKVDARGAKYACGFFDRTAGGVRFVGHGGGAPGMNGDLEIDPQSGYVVAVLANLDPPAAQRVAEFITNRLSIGATAAGAGAPEG